MGTWVGMAAVLAFGAAATIWLQQVFRTVDRSGARSGWRFGAVGAAGVVLDFHPRRDGERVTLPRCVRIRREMTVAGIRFPAESTFWLAREGEIVAFVAAADVEVEGRPVARGERAEVTSEGRFARYAASAAHRFAVIGAAELWCDAGDIVDATLEIASPVRRAIEIEGVALGVGTLVWMDAEAGEIGAQLADAHRVHGAELPAGATLRILMRSWIGRALRRDAPDVIATFPDEGDYRTPAGRRVITICREEGGA